MHELQPDCLVSGRVGNALGDYGICGDNQIPTDRLPGDWETPATINDTWGYKSDDHNWKSVEDLTAQAGGHRQQGRQLPAQRRPHGRGPHPAAERGLLRAVGRWLKVNGEAIYGAGRTPFGEEFGA